MPSPTDPTRDSGPGQVYGWLYEACRTLPCILAERHGHICLGPVTPHHIKRVGAGGKDWENIVPMCMSLHGLCHGQMWGVTERDIERQFDLDLKAIAVEVTKKLVSGPSADRDML